MAESGAPNLVAPSQETHLVFEGSFLGGNAAMLIPRTSDERVVFAIPWHGHALVGTTDTPVAGPSLEPMPLEEEIEFILVAAAQYLDRSPARSGILSAFAGIRPLVRERDTGNTAALSRDHTIQIQPSGLVTITGGKWTTYRRMAEDCVNQAAAVAGLPKRPCTTKRHSLHGSHGDADGFGHLSVYGSDAPAIHALIRGDPGLGEPLDPSLPYVGAEVVWAPRFEMAGRSN